MTRRLIAKKVAPLLLDPKSRKATIEQIAAYLVEEKKTKESSLLINDISLELEKRGHSSVELRSAHEISEQVRRDIVQTIKKLTGASEVTLNETIDQSLLGGIIATTPSTEIDLSIRTKLRTLSAKEV